MYSIALVNDSLYSTDFRNVIIFNLQKLTYDYFLSEVDNYTRGLYVFEDNMYLYGSLNLQIGEFFYRNIVKYNLATNSWEYLDVLPDLVNSVCIFGDLICFLGSFEFALGGQLVRNIICANKSGHFVESLNGGIQNIAIAAQYDPQTGNLYVLDINNNLFYYNNISRNWNSAEKNNIQSLVIQSKLRNHFFQNFNLQNPDVCHSTFH